MEEKWDSDFSSEPVQQKTSNPSAQAAGWPPRMHRRERRVWDTGAVRRGDGARLRHSLLTVSIFSAKSEARPAGVSRSGRRGWRAARFKMSPGKE